MEDGLPQGTDEEHAAATKLQAMQRGKQARKQVDEKRAGVAPEAPAADAQDELPKGTDEEQAAATKLQAMQRGKQARKQVAEKRASVGQLAAPAADAQQDELPTGTAEEHAAATKLQSMQRGKQARKQVEERRAGGAAPPAAAAPAAEELPQGTDEEHKAATKLQSMQRGKQARKQVEEKRAGLAAGEAAPAGAKEDLPQGTDEEHKAATKLQAMQRGKQARKQVEEKRGGGAAAAPAAAEDELPKGTAEEQAAATKLQAMQRGKQARKDVAEKRSAQARFEDQQPSPPGVPPPEAAGGDIEPLATLHPAGGQETSALAIPKDSAAIGSTRSSQAPLKDAQGQADQLIKVKGLDKQQLCIDLLMVGCVQSFVDFFYITHRKAAPAGDNAGEQEPTDVDIPEQTLVFLKETLETAESAHRSQTYKDCFESYNALADYFEEVPDLRSAMYFHHRCVDVAAEVDASDSIAKANLSLGTCEEKANNWQSARQFHERALEIATTGDSLPLQIRAASRLTHVYQVLAEKCEKESRDTDATGYYERCLRCAQLSRDASLEGVACHKLGLSKHKTGDYDAAIELQKQYLDICRVHEDRMGESAARAALAQAHEATGSAEEAIRQLESLLGVASEAGELKAQARACLNLGILYNGSGDHEKSVELLEQHFDLARQIGDRRLIDSARVVLGMVRGSGKLPQYVDLVNNDLDRLLKWKSKRQMLDVA